MIQQEAPKYSSEIEIFQNLVKPFIGAGILALPSAFSKGGVVGSSVLLIIIALVSYYGIDCLLQTANVLRRRYRVGAVEDGSNTPKLNNDSSLNNDINSPLFDEASSQLIPNDEFNHKIESFEDVAYAAFGKRGRWVANTMLICTQTGCCIAYMAFISSNMNDVISKISPVVWLVISVCVISVLAQIRHMKYVAPFSGLGNFVYLFAVCSVFYYGFSHTCCIHGSQVRIANFKELPLVFGTSVFALEGIGLVLPVEKSMQNKERFPALMKAAVATVTTCYLLFGNLGYLFFGDETQSIITKNLGNDPLASVVKVTLSISLMMTYAVQVFPVTELFDLTVLKHYRPQVSADDSEIHEFAKPKNFYVIGTGFRVLIVIVTAVIAGVFPNFGLIVSFVGAFSNSALAFILPMAFYLKVCRPPPAEYGWRFYLAPYLLIIVGVLASVVGVTQTIIDAVNGDS